RMAEYVDALVEGVGQDAVRPALWVHVDGFDQSLGFDIPHRNRAAAGKPMSGFDVDGRAIRPGIGDFTGWGKTVEIENGHAAGKRVVALYGAAWDVEPPPGSIRLDVIEAAQATYLRRLQHFIGSRRGGILRETGNC